MLNTSVQDPTWVMLRMRYTLFFEISYSQFVFVHLTRFSISKGSLDECATSMSVSTTCPSDPHTCLWAANGTRWNPSDTSYEWQNDKYSVSEDSESVTVIFRYKPWSYERLKVIYINLTSYFILLRADRN